MQNTVEAGKLTPTPLPEVVQALEQDYASLPPRVKLLAIARTLRRTCQDSANGRDHANIDNPGRPRH